MRFWAVAQRCGRLMPQIFAVLQRPECDCCAAVPDRGSPSTSRFLRAARTRTRARARAGL